MILMMSSKHFDVVIYYVLSVIINIKSFNLYAQPYILEKIYFIYVSNVFNV